MYHHGTSLEYKRIFLQEPRVTVIPSHGITVTSSIVTLKSDFAMCALHFDVNCNQYFMTLFCLFVGKFRKLHKNA